MSNWEKDNWCVSILAEAMTWAQKYPRQDASHITQLLRAKIEGVLERQRQQIHADLLAVADEGELEDLRREVERYFKDK